MFQFTLCRTLLEKMRHLQKETRVTFTVSSALIELQDLHFRVMILPATTGREDKMESCRVVNLAVGLSVNKMNFGQTWYFLAAACLGLHAVGMPVTVS